MKPDEGYYKQGMRYLEKMVDTNRMPVGEFYMQRAQLLECVNTGVDDKKTRTCGNLIVCNHVSYILYNLYRYK